MDNDSIKELLVRRAQLDAQIAACRAAGRIAVLRQIIALIQEYDITADDIALLNIPTRGVTRPRRKVEPRYWDPESGATWSGRGRRPRWMVGRDPEAFRIQARSSLSIEQANAPVPISHENTF